jgi:ABC-type multidrug transport system fused ATPase/permease subunit
LERLGPWIDSLPDDPDTHVGEQGERLSGGRYQRLASRTQSAEPSLLALGELTALD